MTRCSSPAFRHSCSTEIRSCASTPYYILSDLIEIPNLGSRAQRYIIISPALAVRPRGGARSRDAVGERFWFIVYAPASFIYRMFTLFGIALFVSSKYFFVGVALTLWMLATAILWRSSRARASS